MGICAETRISSGITWNLWSSASNKWMQRIPFWAKKIVGGNDTVVCILALGQL